LSKLCSYDLLRFSFIISHYNCSSCRSALPQCLSTCRWVCFLILPHTLVKTRDNFSTLILHILLPDTLPPSPLPFVAHGYSGTSPSHIRSDRELSASSTPFIICNYLSAVFFFGGSVTRTVHTFLFSNPLSPSRFSLLLLFEVSCYYALVSYSSQV
jgi:hypothetical protein